MSEKKNNNNVNLAAVNNVVHATKKLAEAQSTGNKRQIGQAKRSFNKAVNNAHYFAAINDALGKRSS